jgi:hypothetical protein
MKIGLLLPTNIHYAPYVQIYIKILNKYHIEYDIINWDREGLDEDSNFQFKYQIDINSNKIKRLFGYILFVQFIKKTLRENNYSKLIVFTSQLGIFLLNFLKKNYYNLFIFDYRDLSINLYFKYYFKKLLSISFLNVISSPGYKLYLPPEYNYLLSHNFDINIMQSKIKSNIRFIVKDFIVISTIGFIRDYDQSIEIIKLLANNDKYKLMFVGKGPASKRIYDFVITNNISNVEIIGSYKKEEEINYYKQATFINIYRSHSLNNDTGMTNRFYNAVIYGKPMIVPGNTTQSDYVKKYKLGISVNNINEIENDIISYIDNFDDKEYKKNRLALIEEFINDYTKFEKMVISAINIS